MAIKLFGKTIQMFDSSEVLVMYREENTKGDGEAASKMMNCHERSDGNAGAPVSSEEEGNEEGNEEKEKKADTNDQQNKPPKKTDKVLLCPRCNSRDTKFCYFNNYNVNQPRHFCKNCQRYWTAGGSMRNVPVGAGRRKSKIPAANRHYRNINSRECSENDFLESVRHSDSLKPNRKPSSVERTPMSNCNPNAEDHQSNKESNPSANLNFYGFPSYLNGGELCNLWTQTPPSTFPIPFYQVSAYWSMPWLPLPPLLSPSFGSSCSVQHSTNLGKHTREGNMLNHGTDPSESENSLWIPKTLKIDDPEEAAKSSLWEALGFNKQKAGSMISGEDKDKNKLSEKASLALCANPAAHSRSVGFQERL